MKLHIIKNLAVCWFTSECLLI